MGDINTPKDFKQQVLSHLRRYSAIEALSGNENAIWDVVASDFNTDSGVSTVTSVIKDGNIFYGTVINSQASPGKKLPLWIAHLDRVPNCDDGSPLVDTIVDFEERGYVRGQLDNIISIAILKVLFDMHLPLNIMFTTSEEIVKSDIQIAEFLSAAEFNFYNPITNYDKYYPITLDIDVFDSLESLIGKGISIRDRDNNSDFDFDLVFELRKLADELGLKYVTTEGYAIVETGFLANLTSGSMLGAHIGIPINNYHTGMECAMWDTIEDAYSLIFSILTR